jgi:hypothetical protein
VVIAVGFALTFVWRDARKHGINPIPYVVRASWDRSGC